MKEEIIMITEKIIDLSKQIDEETDENKRDLLFEELFRLCSLSIKMRNGHNLK